MTFRDVDFRFRLAPFVRLGMIQTNYRAYVRAGDQRAVWFFGSTLSTPIVEVPRLLWKMPWTQAPATIEATWDATTLSVLAVTRGGGVGRLRHRARPGTPEPMGRLDGFADELETARVLTHPMAGYYRRLDCGVAGYHVWHAADAADARSTPSGPDTTRWNAWAWSRSDQAPHSVLLERRSDFRIYLPPTRLDGPMP